MGQLSFFPDVNEKEVRKEVAKQLKKYKAYKVAVQNKSEQENEGMDQLFPVFNEKQKEKLIIVRQIERALQNALDDLEREVIERTYLSNKRTKDINVYMDMGLTKDQYYMHKGNAIKLIATALGII